jgi:hypothetical protein
LQNWRGGFLTPSAWGVTIILYVNAPKTCPHCGSSFGPQRNSNTRLSRDHIYPIEWNRVYRVFANTDQSNVRYCCQRCNGYRSYVNHCVGALACVLDIARQTKRRPMTVIIAWKFYELRKIGDTTIAQKSSRNI